jgi:type VI secretion system protein ImpF
MRQAIIDFEPRIMAASVEVIASELQINHHNIVSMEIRGSLWGQPTPLELLFRTEVDLETGEVEIRDLAG